MRFPNFYHSESFKWRFGRDPKVWAISGVHDIWLKLKLRNSERYRNVSKHLNHIKENFQKNGDGEWIVYFRQGDRVRGYRITEEGGYLGYSIIDPKMGRELKINLITGEGFQLDEKLHYLVSLTSRFDHDIFRHLSRMIQDEVFKDMYKRPYNRKDFKKVIKISGRTYIFDATGGSESVEMWEIKEGDIINLD